MLLVLREKLLFKMDVENFNKRWKSSKYRHCISSTVNKVLHNFLFVTASKLRQNCVQNTIFLLMTLVKVLIIHVHHFLSLYFHEQAIDGLRFNCLLTYCSNALLVMNLTFYLSISFYCDSIHSIWFANFLVYTMALYDRRRFRNV